MWSEIFLTFLSLMTQQVLGDLEKSAARFVPPPPPFFPPMLYPTNAATGILVAIAVPVPLDGQNVFVSYNFEGNFNMPNQPIDSFPSKIIRWTSQNLLNFPDVYGPPDDGPGTADDVIARNIKIEANETKIVVTQSESSQKTETTTEINSVEAQRKIKRSLDDQALFTRHGIYHLIESRLNANSVDGKKCLLLAICEAAEVPFLEHSGVLGHLLHIVLTPSSSMDEKLPKEYNKAENLGKTGNCSKYKKKCSINVLNLISKIF